MIKLTKYGLLTYLLLITFMIGKVIVFVHQHEDTPCDFSFHHTPGKSIHHHAQQQENCSICNMPGGQKSYLPEQDKTWQGCVRIFTYPVYTIAAEEINNKTVRSRGPPPLANG